MRVEPQQLKAFLVDSGLVSAAEIEKIEKESSQKKKDFDELMDDISATSSDVDPMHS